MDVQQLLQAMTPEVFQRLEQAVATGKWLDGSPLTEEQRGSCMQAVLLYQARVAQSDEHMTVGKNGEIVQKSRAQLKQEMQQAASKQTPIARFSNDDI